MSAIVLVDTSVWIASFRGREKTIVHRLSSLMDANQVALAAPVRVEILSGASAQEQTRLKRLLSVFPAYYPSDETWALIDRWVAASVKAGHRFGFADLLIAAIAAQGAMPIWSLDQDFKRMARLGFISVLEN